MKDLLQGKPMRHPLHPFLVHFPIGLFALSLPLDIAGVLWLHIGGFRSAATISLGTGVVMALLAAVPGFVDYTDIRRDHPARKLAVTHMLLNLVAVGLYAANLGLRQTSAGAPGHWLPVLLSAAAFGVLAFSGHLGGKMVFDNGIAVGRHRRKTRSPDETLRFTGPGETFAVGRAEELRDGETLRVDVNGTVLAIARSGEEFRAFQEFCSHRYGPLSEGCVRDGQIECPWHRSRFEMGNGQVTQGPAKVALRTFPVQVVNGQITVTVRK